MAGLGTDAVSFCVQESQLTNWHQQRVRSMVDRIHAHGMKAHAVPNRWAGLFAGWLDGFGRFTVENPDTLIQSEEGTILKKGEIMYMDCNWKLAMNANGLPYLLFDMKKDPEEQNNLVNDASIEKTITELRIRILEHLIRTQIKL